MAQLASPSPLLTPSQLDATVDEALVVWQAAGVNDDQLEQLGSVEFVIADLPGAHLGQSLGRTITIDANAAGYGWFVDPTPGASEEFSDSGAHGLVADKGGPAADRMDLLTVVLHELGHVLGHGDLDDILTDDIMSGWLPVGVRRL